MKIEWDRKMKKRIFYGAFVVLALAGLLVYGIIRDRQQQKSLLILDSETGTRSEEQTNGSIMVHVAGEVVSPGLYTLPANARVHDAIEAAGGLTPEGDEDALNLAAMVNDGDKITIYPKQEAGDTDSDSSSPKRSVPYRVNINTASREELESLPGIGEVLAGNIITYREEHNGFSTIEEIKEVNRIGDKLFEQIKDQLTI